MGRKKKETCSEKVDKHISKHSTIWQWWLPLPSGTPAHHEIMLQASEKKKKYPSFLNYFLKTITLQNFERKRTVSLTAGLNSSREVCPACITQSEETVLPFRIIFPFLWRNFNPVYWTTLKLAGILTAPPWGVELITVTREATSWIDFPDRRGVVRHCRLVHDLMKWGTRDPDTVFSPHRWDICVARRPSHFSCDEHNWRAAGALPGD